MLEPSAEDTLDPPPPLPGLPPKGRSDARARWQKNYFHVERPLGPYKITFGVLGNALGTSI
jgi:hypothetical protein